MDQYELLSRYALILISGSAIVVLMITLKFLKDKRRSTVGKSSENSENNE